MPNVLQHPIKSKGGWPASNAQHGGFDLQRHQRHDQEDPKFPDADDARRNWICKFKRVLNVWYAHVIWYSIFVYICIINYCLHVYIVHGFNTQTVDVLMFGGWSRSLTIPHCLLIALKPVLIVCFYERTGRNWSKWWRKCFSRRSPKSCKHVHLATFQGNTIAQQVVQTEKQPFLMRFLCISSLLEAILVAWRKSLQPQLACKMKIMKITHRNRSAWWEPHSRCCSETCDLLWRDHDQLGASSDLTNLELQPTPHGSPWYLMLAWFSCEILEAMNTYETRNWCWTFWLKIKPSCLYWCFVAQRSSYCFWLHRGAPSYLSTDVLGLPSSRNNLFPVCFDHAYVLGISWFLP